MQDRNGKTVYRHEPRDCVGCGEAPAGGRSRAPPQIVDKRQPFHDPASVYQVVNMMLGVTTRGTAGQLAVLGRPIAGKTGTTNDSRDNWFIGSTPDLTIGIYVGFDEPRTLGDQETGGGTSAPVYERIARVVFKDKPPVPFRIPPGAAHRAGRPRQRPAELRRQLDRRGLQARHRAQRIRRPGPEHRRRQRGVGRCGVGSECGRRRRRWRPAAGGRPMSGNRRDILSSA